MVARRVSSDPIIVIMTSRGGHDTTEAARIERLHLLPLSFIDANRLLDARPDSPGGKDRRVLLELADGNPLALVELPVVGHRAAQLEAVPLTHRLELAFAGRYAELPYPARLGVLAVAFGCDSIDETTTAIARALEGRQPANWLAMAATAGLLEPRQSRIGFRHPLVRSAVASVAEPLERSTMLQALVDTIAQPSRTVWWRADLASGPDHDLAAELAGIGHASLAAGDAPLAMRALCRAAELTAKSPSRIDLLLLAAEAAGRAGAHKVAFGLLEEVHAETDDLRSRSRAGWLRNYYRSRNLHSHAVTCGPRSPPSRGSAGRVTRLSPWTPCCISPRSRGITPATPILANTSPRRHAPFASIPMSPARSCWRP